MYEWGSEFQRNAIRAFLFIVMIAAFGVIFGMRNESSYLQSINAHPAYYVIAAVIGVSAIYGLKKMDSIHEPKVVLKEKHIGLKTTASARQKLIKSRLKQVMIDPSKPVRRKGFLGDVWCAHFENGKRVYFLVPHEDRESVEKWKKEVIGKS